MTLGKAAYIALFAFCWGYVQADYPGIDCVGIPPSDDLTQEKFIEILTDPCRYDKLTKPPTDEPLEIIFQVKLEYIDTMDKVGFTLYMVVQYQYNDNRLAYKDFSPNRTILVGEDLLRSKIWIPHMVIKNEQESNIMGMEGNDVFVTISPEGEVLFSYRTTVQFYCSMNLVKFPFDTQECELSWGSLRYNVEDLVLKWDDNGSPLKLRNLHLTEFLIDTIQYGDRIVPGSFDKGHLAGNYSELTIKFKLYREIGYYMMDYFLPSVLLVCTAWVTFWLQADAGPPRATLGASTVVAFITLNLGLSSSIPKVSYVKASDVWFLACSCFIFGSLAEFAFVNVIWRRRKPVELKKQTPKHILKGALTPSVARNDLRKEESRNSLYKPRSFNSLNMQLPPHFLTNQDVNSISGNVNSQEDVGSDGSTVSIPMTDSPEEVTWTTMTPQEVAIWVDRKARMVFPLAFIIFNIFYWTFVFVL